MALIRRSHPVITGLVVAAALFYLWTMSSGVLPRYRASSTEERHYIEAADYFWTRLPLNYPPDFVRPLPETKPVKYPKIQYPFTQETAAARKVREERQQAVKETFSRCWSAPTSSTHGSQTS
ncbi:hypothetical protein NUW58_g8095 [Xylaria curta]|uniref:Uncharacterized protein n=1 Tax=Xylaria curta TaxID=42375 RepID=A0ACC1ND96_9PEZI|nr:hypothetical protein NUW58_g8095 [Xylaria curta]